MMKNNSLLHVAIAETSVIIRSGLAIVLKRLPNLNIHLIEVSTVESLFNYINLHSLDLLIINPTFEGWFDVKSFKSNFKNKDIKCLAIICTVIDKTLLRDYDDSISVYESLEVITEKMTHLISSPSLKKESELEALSQREKEIIVYVVKGMTNKAIADKLYLSIHTVITHRRNIARKLQIHSSAGLTIYAIVNKLVELQDVKDLL